MVSIGQMSVFDAASTMMIAGTYITLNHGISEGILFMVAAASLTIWMRAGIPKKNRR